MIRRAFLVALTLLPGSPAAAQEGRPGFVFDAARAEHLWNRAGFGAAPEDIQRAVELGLEDFVSQLFGDQRGIDAPFYERLRGVRGVRGSRGREDDEPMAMARREDGEQLRDYLAWWTERLVEGRDPLQERMTLFWHGHFTSSMQDVRNSHEMIVQNQLLRRHALGSFRDMIHAIARDPAMLEYLDNDSNRAGSPNENFARELMELFTLGEGNYSEQDVKEAARAFTGWTDLGGSFRFVRAHHDFGVKTVLGVTGRLDGDDVIDILLAEDACPRYLAGRILAYLEGAAPDELRLEHYATRLRDLDFHIGEFLRELFLDPDFYREEVLGTRISGPVDFIVGTSRRLGVEPPPALLTMGSSILGQRLFFPPNVKGWEGGAAWITTSSLMQRGNLAGILLGQVELEDFLSLGEDLEASSDAATDEMNARGRGEFEPRGAGARTFMTLRRLERRDWKPRLNLTALLRRAGVGNDREAVLELTDRLLAVPLDSGARENLIGALGKERSELGIAEHHLLEHGRDSEELLRRFAHLLMSLPEAQLN